MKYIFGLLILVSTQTFAYDVFECLNKSVEEAQKIVMNKTIAGKKVYSVGVHRVNMNMDSGVAPKIQLTVSAHLGKDAGNDSF